MKAIKTFAAVAAAIISAVSFTSCGNAPRLEGEWEVVALEGADVALAEETPTVTIDLSLMCYSVFTGVNYINGDLKLDKEAVSFGEGAMTRRMGAPESMEVEAAFVAALPAISAFEQPEEGKVVLKGADGASLMTLEKK